MGHWHFIRKLAGKVSHAIRKFTACLALFTYITKLNRRREVESHLLKHPKIAEICCNYNDIPLNQKGSSFNHKDKSFSYL